MSNQASVTANDKTPQGMPTLPSVGSIVMDSLPYMYGFGIGIMVFTFALNQIMAPNHSDPTPLSGTAEQVALVGAVLVGLAWAIAAVYFMARMIARKFAKHNKIYRERFEEQQREIDELKALDDQSDVPPIF